MDKRTAKAILEQVLGEMSQNQANEFLRHDLTYQDNWEELLRKVYYKYFEAKT